MEFQITRLNLDKERRLKLTLRGISEFQQATGRDLMELDDLQDLTPRELYVLLWACLLWEDKELKLEAIPGLIEPVDGITLMTALLECIANSLPEAKPDSIPLAEKPAESTGSAPGPLPDSISTSKKFLSGS